MLCYPLLLLLLLSLLSMFIITIIIVSLVYQQKVPFLQQYHALSKTEP